MPAVAGAKAGTQVAKHLIRPFTLLTAGALLALLFLAFTYFWNYNYKYTLPEEPDQRRVHAALRVVPESGPSGGFSAIFSLHNVSQHRIRLLDTAGLAPLYAVRLVNRDTGQAVPLRHPLSAQAAYDKDVDALVELVPGSEFAHPISLSELFDLQAGKYELAVDYQPNLLARDDLPVDYGMLAARTNFEVPEVTNKK